MKAFFQQPLISVAMAACLGSAIGTHLAIHQPVMVLVAILTGVVLMVFCRHKPLALYGLVLATVAVFWVRSTAICLQTDQQEKIGPRRDITLLGVLSGLPTYDVRQDVWKGIATIREARYADTSLSLKGKVQFVCTSEISELFPGQAVILQGSLSPFDPPRNPGEFDYQAYQRRQGIAMRLKGRLHTDRSKKTTLTGWIWKNTFRLRNHLQSNIYRVIHPRARPLILAITTGNRSEMDDWQREKLIIAGLGHMIAISGMHVGIIYGAIILGMMVFGFTRRQSMAFGIICVAFFAMLTGFQIPILRCFVMLAGVTVSELFYRPANSLCSLALAVIIILLLHPCTAMDAGFQLSVLATFSIIYIIPFTQKNTHGKPFYFKTIISMIIVSCVAYIGTLPIIQFHFFQISSYAILTNLITVPLLGITMTFGIVSGFFGNVPIVGMVVGKVGSLGALSIITISEWIQIIPYNRIFSPKPPVWWVVVYYIVLIFAFSLLRMHNSNIKTRKTAMILIVMVILTSISMIFRDETVYLNMKIKVNFLSLNIGEAIFIRTDKNLKILIDCGTEQEFFRRVKPFLASQGIRSLDMVILSHADEDHAGGLKPCLAFFNVRTVAYSGWDIHRMEKFRDVERLIKIKKINVLAMSREDKLPPEMGLDCRVLWPPKGTMTGKNDDSLCLCIEFRGIKMFFPGDAPARVQQEWLWWEKVDLFKTAHHGDLQAVDAGLMTRIHPGLTVVMPGNHNRFGFPDEEAIRQLRIESDTVLDTKEWGAIEVIYTHDGTKYWYANPGYARNGNRLQGGGKFDRIKYANNQ